MSQPYGLLAEFSTHEQLLHAAEQAHAAGFRKMDAFAPFPVEGLPEALGKKTRLPLLVLIGGIFGGVGAYYMEWYANAVSYVINIGELMKRCLFHGCGPVEDACRRCQ